MIKILILFGCAILLFCLFFFGWSLSSFSVHIRRQTLDEAIHWQSSHYDVSWYDTFEKEKDVFTCEDGYKLHTLLLKNPKPSDRYVIISHGYTDNRYGSLKYAKMYLDLGFNVLLYDLRGHGENQETYCTYSIREGKDLNELIRKMRSLYGSEVTLGIHGESLGAASSIACLKYSPSIQFVVSDCGFSEILSVMKNGLKKMHLPGCLVYLSSLFTRMRFGFSYQDMRPIDSLKGCKIPILYIHGSEDDFVCPDHSVKMQEATEGYSELHIIPHAPHAASVLTAPAQYQSILSSFLSHVLK